VGYCTDASLTPLRRTPGSGTAASRAVPEGVTVRDHERWPLPISIRMCWYPGETQDDPVKACPRATSTGYGAIAVLVVGRAAAAIVTRAAVARATGWPGHGKRAGVLTSGRADAGANGAATTGGVLHGFAC